MIILPPEVESAWHAGLRGMRGPSDNSPGGFLGRFEKRALCANAKSSALAFRACDKRYRPEDRCNGCFHYNSDVRYKRQTLPPYSQRSTEFAGGVEILGGWAHNRYKRQSLTSLARSWRKVTA
jgi:hypothetical protein